MLIHKYIRWLGLVVLAAWLLLTLPTAPARAQGIAPVLIYYYVWWYPEAMGPGKTPDWPDPLYYSSDPAVLERQVSQMAGAGADGLIVGWFGPDEPTTEGRFKTVLDLAAAYGTTALLSVDLGTASFFGDTQAIIDGMRHALNTHVNHPAYFRYNGKPVFVFWFQGRYSLDDWAAIRQAVDPDHTTIWIAEGAVPDAIGAFDGLHMYTISWSDNVAGTLAYWGNVTHQRGGVWMATAMPGWDNTYTQQSERYIRDREDGGFFRETFAGAAASNPDLILITSWNEWAEGSYVEPSVKYGDFYLTLMGQLIGEYKSSGAVAGGGGSAPPVQPTQEPPAGSGSTPSPAPPSGATPTPGNGVTVTSTVGVLPTITPTASLSASPIWTATPTDAPTQVAQAVTQQMGPDMKPPEEGEVATATPERALLERLILGSGIVAGGIGLILLAVVGALAARARTKAPRP